MFLLVFDREREREAKKREMAKKYIEEDQKMREQWKELERQRLEEENREIQRFAELQKQREAERKEVKKEQEAFKSKVQEEVSIYLDINRDSWQTFLHSAFSPTDSSLFSCKKSDYNCNLIYSTAVKKDCC